ncbi:MAG: hypothetical protein V3U68_01485 [Bacteroidota bacterium]
MQERKLPGRYSVNYVTGNLPSGVYFYTLPAGPFSHTRKMVLAR